MVEITNVKVYELTESVIACRNAMRVTMPEYTEVEFTKSLTQAKLLAKSPTNSGHSNFLTGIRVSFDIKYPNYFSPELQRYHFLDIVTSSSKMHRLSKIGMSDAFNKYVDKEVIDLLRKYIKKYESKPTYENMMIMLSNCPLGIELFMRCSTNYLQLKTIFFQRRNHKLKDWHNFIAFIEKLPYFREFILADTESVYEYAEQKPGYRDV